MMASPEGAIRGDHGLGLCLTCLFDHKKAARDRAAAQRRGARTSALPARAPQFAIALVPAPAPVPGPDGVIVGLTMVAVGACYDHIGIATTEGNGHAG
jgi:hypothetical protein